MPINKDPSPAFGLPLNKDETYLIGAFIIVWNQLEYLVSLQIYTLLGLGPEIVNQVMEQNSLNNKINFYTHLVEAKIPDKIIQENSVQCGNLIKKLSNFRNEIAHGYWVWNTDINKPVATKKPFPQQYKTDINALEQNYVEICKLSNRMADLYWKIYFYLKTNNSSCEPSPWHNKF